MAKRAKKESKHAEAPYWADPVEVVRAQLDELMNHISSGVAVYKAVDDGKDFVFVDFNRAAAKIEQVEREALIGRSVLDVFPGVREFGLLEVFQRVWRTGQPERHPISVYKDERISGWRQNYVCRLPNGHVMAVYDDVTQHKRSELAARMSEQCFSAIANYTYDWEVWVGPTGRVLWTNPAVTRVTGYTVKELIAMPNYPEPIVHEQDRERILRAFRSALKGGTGNDVQFRIWTREGKTVWVAMSWQPIYDESSNSLGHRESIRDITVRKQIEQALQQAQCEKETILDNLRELIVQLDPDLKVIWANQAACRAVGLSRDEAIGRRCYELWAEGDEPCRDCPVTKAMETGSLAETEKVSPDGRIWRVHATPIRDRAGRIVGGAEIAMDMTEYKTTQEALGELQERCRLLKADLDALRGRSGGAK